MFGILVKKNGKISRNEIMKRLLKKNIETRPFFLSMNKQKIFKKMNLFNKVKVPNSEYLSKNGFYLPSGLGITNKQIDFVIKNLLKIIS